MKIKKKFRKVVKYQWEDSSMLILWPFLILAALTFPIWYWWPIREVHWEEIKCDWLGGNHDG